MQLGLHDCWSPRFVASLSLFPLLGPAVFLYSSAGMVDMGVETVSISRCSWWGKVEALARADDAASSSYSTSEQPLQRMKLLLRHLVEVTSLLISENASMMTMMEVVMISVSS